MYSACHCACILGTHTSLAKVSWEQRKKDLGAPVRGMQRPGAIAEMKLGCTCLGQSLADKAKRNRFGTFVYVKYIGAHTHTQGARTALRPRQERANEGH